MIPLREAIRRLELADVVSNVVELRPTTPLAEEWRAAELARLRAIEAAARVAVAAGVAWVLSDDPPPLSHPMRAALVTLSDALDGGG